jgi:hypothetical protein
MSIQFCWRSSVSLRNNPHCTTIYFCQCWFSPTFPLRWCLPWFVYADITLETVALLHLMMWQFSSQMLQPNAHQWPVLFQNLTGLLSFRFFHTITTALTRALECVNKRKFFYCSQEKFCSSVSYVSIILSTTCMCSLLVFWGLYPCL